MRPDADSAGVVEDDAEGVAVSRNDSVGAVPHGVVTEAVLAADRAVPDGEDHLLAKLSDHALNRCVSTPWRSRGAFRSKARSFWPTLVGSLGPVKDSGVVAVDQQSPDVRWREMAQSDTSQALTVSGSC